MTETYFHEVICKNCKANNKLQIQRGTTIKEFMQEQECFKCGCKLGEK